MVTARSSCPYLKKDIAVAKTDQDKLKQFPKQLKFIITTKIELRV